MQSAAVVGVRCGARRLCRGPAGTRELAAKVAFVCANGGLLPATSAKRARATILVVNLPIFTMARTEILESFRSPTAQSLLVPQLRGTLRMRNGNVASKEPLLCIILASIPRNCRLKWRAELLLLSAECCFGCTGESHVFHPTDRKQTFVIEQPRGCAHRRRSAETRTRKVKRA